MATRAAPFDSLRIDDLGDVATNPFNCLDSIERIQALTTACSPRLGDRDDGGRSHHCVADSARNGQATRPAGWCTSTPRTRTHERFEFGERIAHGTPFRRAVEEGLLDCKRVRSDRCAWYGLPGGRLRLVARAGFPRRAGRGCWHRSLDPLMAEIRTQIGDGRCTSASTSRPRPVVCARHRNAGDRRAHDLAGHEIIRDHPRRRGLKVVGCEWSCCPHLRRVRTTSLWRPTCCTRCCGLPSRGSSAARRASPPTSRAGGEDPPGTSPPSFGGLHGESGSPGAQLVAGHNSKSHDRPSQIQTSETASGLRPSARLVSVDNPSPRYSRRGLSGDARRAYTRRRAAASTSGSTASFLGCSLPAGTT